ncbi:enoyl-CoA hydratase/isomerase family protein [Rhodococcus sp. IEGM 1305]|uniref:enoyl-CoA hydratase/isomerase family protein n=1 Tax=Rhodococcus sp. IEGM 1305 TaxID=3047092 RepID=UPI0024B759BC|nr:enoyl-CoA hydratase/isomerase family protein [Rhodococcus sp. IEGM 1305]MDI9950998.1 enoyl-CoA hydratase/isomerase family protein [Rhodococcus sp. IEGM 1305]
MTATLTYQDTIAVLDLGDDENRFSPEWLDTVDRLLDDAHDHGAQALVTTATGKFYSNGLDLDWLMANGDRADWYVGRVQALFSRILTLPLPTVAAVNGHAFGAGAMLGIAHDYRVMRSDRGYYCFPEVDIHIPFTPGMAALIQAKLTPQTAITAMTTGRRYGGPAAQTSGLVDGTAPEGAVLGAAVDLIAPLAGKDTGTLGAIKSTMFAPAVAALASGRS